MLRSWFLNIILKQKEAGLLGKVYDSMIGARKIQDVPGTFVVLENKEVLKKDGSMSKGHKS